MNKIDLHCHTVASPDGGLSQHDIAAMLQSGQLNTIAITDHNTIDEAVRLQGVFGDAIIIGEEIMTTDGEIIGLYLYETIPAGLSPAETVRRIKQQDGLVYIPHPFEKVRSGISLIGLNKIADDVDLIEIRNGRSFSKKSQEAAIQWARNRNLPGIASSDTHGRIGWGQVYSELNAAPERTTLVALAGSAILRGNKNGYRNYVYPKLNRLKKFLHSSS